MKNREIKSILAVAIVPLCLTAAAYAASAGTGSTSSSGTSAAGTNSGSQAGTAAAPAGAGMGSATAPSATSTNAQGTAPTTTAATEYNDGEIVGMVMALDGNEIAAGEAAEKKKMGKEAKEFAKMMIKQHRADSNKVAKLAKKHDITPANTSRVEELKNKGASELRDLSAKDSLEFEQAYISAMVQGHTDALALFDDHLIKDAKNEKLKKQLEETRKAVAMHLEHAKRLQGARASR